jgi:His-Xaa-Ser system radical SAM maturase HxsC
MRLHTTGTAVGFKRPIVARVVTDPVPIQERKDTALLMDSLRRENDFNGYSALIVRDSVDRRIDVPIMHSVRATEHLSSGYVVALEPTNGFIRTLYRPDSYHNTLFVTERCNSNCLMCSQPPANKDDIAALTERNRKLIDFISPKSEYLCITGGEPTLLGQNLLKIVRKLRDKLPAIHIHILTNGRRFAWKEFTRSFAEINHPRISLGIPLYADDARLHDYIVQARDAFDQTVLGMHELARYDIEIEIRVVLHALTIPRLTHLSEYICRNITFAHHVSFMGMEHIGHAPRNMQELWIDPADYQVELERAVAVLGRFGIEARIYNLQLCVLEPKLWKFSKQAISDWKNAYKPVCKDCAVQGRCGGFFQWATEMQSRSIHPIKSS